MVVSEIILGMDEAGRGPVIGPMVFGIAGGNNNQLDVLRYNGVNDSKKLSSSTRDRFYKLISESLEIADTLVYSAKKITMMMETMSLNEIEVEGYRELLSQYVSRSDIVYLDAADAVADRFGKKVTDGLKIRYVSEHKADSRYTIVGAASILAKVTRDKIIEELGKEYSEKYPDIPPFRSGYPMDARKFLEEYYHQFRNFPPIVRTKWKSCKRIVNRYKENSIDDFF